MAALWGLLCAPSHAGAQEAAGPRASAGIAIFSDDLATTIYSPHASAGATLPGGVETDVAWRADVISSASVDVVTAATGRMNELRNQIGISGARENVGPDLDLHGGYTYSTENDSYSHIAQIGLRKSFSQDNVEVGAQYGFSYNRTGLVSESSDLWHTLIVNNLDLDLVYLFDADTQVDLIYSGAWNSGYMESPYRRVPITFRDDLRGSQWVDEEVPDTRLRHAITARFRRAFGPHVLAYLDYRFYVDSWSVISHTAQLELAVRMTPVLTIQLRGRGTVQGGASFYEARYAAPRRYVTRDRRLGAHLSAMFGGAILWRLGSLLGLDALNLRMAADGVVWRYDDFMFPQLTPTGDATQRSLGTVWGLIAQLGVQVRL